LWWKDQSNHSLVLRRQWSFTVQHTPDPCNPHALTMPLHPGVPDWCARGDVPHANTGIGGLTKLPPSLARPA
jgi:hypothetical protein